MPNPYETLGVAKDASTDEIKRAFRKLSHQHHPDKGGDAKQFQEINQAYQILSDPQKRDQFDQFGHVGNGGPAGAGGFGGFGGGAGRAGGFGFDFTGGTAGGGLGDIFDDIFGAAFSNIQAEVQISPAQAVMGDKMELRTGEEKIVLTIPPGTQDGQAFTFRGRGKAHNRGRGDLQIVVRIVMPTGNRMSRTERALWEQLKNIGR
ncbi:MAG: DnaJ domain-containing protein [bacterium]|nr:DnaJ domain-containing protein [bacterium]